MKRAVPVHPTMRSVAGEATGLCAHMASGQRTGMGHVVRGGAVRAPTEVRLFAKVEPDTPGTGWLRRGFGPRSNGEPGERAVSSRGGASGG